MGAEAALACPNAVEQDGILYLVGIKDGAYHLRRSADGGGTWLRYSDGSTESRIADAESEQRAALVKLVSQGRPLVACIPRRPVLQVYVSHDDGETWELESTVGPET